MSFHKLLTGLCVLPGALSLVFGLVASEAAPAPVALVDPLPEAYVADAQPTVAWSASVGAVAYEVRVDGQSIGVVDAADCGSPCAVALPDPVAEGRHTWQIVAVDVDDAEAVSPLGSFMVDTVAPRLAFYPSLGTMRRRVGADNCATPTAEPPHIPFVYYSSPIFTISDASPTTVSYRVNGSPVASLCDLPAGDQTVELTMIDRAGNISTGSISIRRDLVSPRVTIEGPTRGAINSRGEWRAVIADGTAVMPARYTWIGRMSLANGLPATGGQTSTALFPYPTTGLTEPLRVYVVDAEGDVGVGSIDLTSGGPKPATGSVGVTVKEEPKYVNHRKLPLKLVWPSGATTFVLDDSAGTRTETAPVKSSNVSWQLGGTGMSKQPTTIRARFDWPSPDTVYEAKVVLDLEHPRLTAAAVRGRTLRIRAHDAISGLDRVQLALDRRKPRSLPFRAKVPIGSARWVRIRDRAGNVSPWIRIRRG